MSPQFAMAETVSMVDFLNDTALRLRIIKWCDENPTSDRLITISYNKEQQKNSPTSFVSGSTALHSLLSFMDICIPWNPSDKDVYILNQPNFSRTQLGDIDLIRVIATSIDDVLLNFDLPICRVAYYGPENEKTFIVSYQAMNGIFRGEQNVVLDSCVCPHFVKTIGRIQKYNLRGYTSICHLSKEDDITVDEELEKEKKSVVTGNVKQVNNSQCNPSPYCSYNHKPTPSSAVIKE